MIFRTNYLLPNITIKNKTIVHVYDNSNGFGDYLRGTLLLASIAKIHNINFIIDISKHPISNSLNVNISNKNNTFLFMNGYDFFSYERL